jgi:hypothetical protein
VSRILKVALGIVATALVVAGAAVVYRETDLLTASLVLLAGLMIATLLARRAAVREERAGMADWEQETLASAEAAEDLFGEWSVSSPRDERTGQEPTAPPMTPAPSVAPPVPTHSNGPASPMPFGAEVPEPADPSVTMSRPLRTQADEPQDTEALVASLFVTDAPPAPPLVDDSDPDPFGIDGFISAPPTPACAGAGAGAPSHAGHGSPIDWTGQGGRVDERVQSSDDILRVSEATALPLGGDTGGSELARLLSKVEARLRDYD